MKLPKWLTPEIKERMGVEADRRLAAEIGVADTVVGSWRRRLGIARIPAATPSRFPILREWLGKYSDAHIARLVGCTRAAVTARRRTLGIPAAPRSASPPPKTEGCWTPDILARLGKESDVSIAKDIGRSASSVFLRRRHLGIAAFKAQRRPAWLTREVISQMGHVSDDVIAASVGRGRGAVKRQRHALGIPAALRIWPCSPTREANARRYKNAKARKLKEGIAQLLEWTQQQNDEKD